MSEPTLYFPDSCQFDLTYKPSRQWGTQAINNSMTGRLQTRKLWGRPKRQMHAGIYASIERGSIVNAGDVGNNDPGIIGGPKLTDAYMFEVIIRPFLNLVAGMANPFYIFDPRYPARVQYGIKIGGWNGSGDPLPVAYPGDLPLTLPSRGDYTGLANCQNAVVIGLAFSPVGGGGGTSVPGSALTLDHGGGGQGTRVTAITSGAPSAGSYYVTGTIIGHERIPVVMTTDIEDLSFNTSMPIPFEEFHFDLEEYFG